MWRGEGKRKGDHCQLSNLVRPRGFIVHPSKPPSPRHSQHNLSNLPCCCSPSPVPSPSRPPPPNPPGSPPKSDFQKSLLSSANPPNLPTPAQATIDGTPTNPTRTNLPPWPRTITGSIPTWPLWTSSQRPSPTHHPGHLGPDDLAACAAGLLLSCTGAPTSSTATIQSTPRHDQKPILPTRRSLFSTSKAFIFSSKSSNFSLFFNLTTPPPFRCARRVLPCCAALPCAAAILVQDQTPSSCDGSAQSSNHQKPRQPRLSPRLPPTAPRAFVFIVLGIADRCTQGA